MEVLNKLTEGVLVFNTLHEVEDIEERKQAAVAIAEGVTKVYYLDGIDIEDEYRYPIPFKITEYKPLRLDGILLSWNDRKITLFYNYEDRKGLNYLIQVNYKGKKVVSTKPIFPIVASPKIYLGFVSNQIVTYTDAGKQVKVNRGLMFIDTDKQGDLKGKYVRRIPIYLPAEIPSNLLNLVQPEDREFVVVDNFDESKFPVVMRLPDEFNSMDSDFSTGLIRLRF